MIGQCMLTEDTFHGSLNISGVRPQCCYGFVLKKGKNESQHANIILIFPGCHPQQKAGWKFTLIYSF